MTEPFKDKFKRGANENARTARNALNNANEAARKTKEGWNTFKMAYDAKAGKTSSSKDDQDKPTASKGKSTTPKKTSKPKSGPLKPKQSES